MQIQLKKFKDRLNQSVKPAVWTTPAEAVALLIPILLSLPQHFSYQLSGTADAKLLPDDCCTICHGFSTDPQHFCDGAVTFAFQQQFGNFPLPCWQLCQSGFNGPTFRKAPL
tara:strand:- start:16 stop:351 length:336 start_codon:yes stop_codon:yes gene_type:complete